jgi:hypothetical protein
MRQFYFDSGFINESLRMKNEIQMIRRIFKMFKIAAGIILGLMGTIFLLFLFVGSLFVQPIVKSASSSTSGSQETSNPTELSTSKFSETEDEFGAGKTQRLTIVSLEPSEGAVTFSCYSGKSLQAQLFSKKTIFPDDVNAQSGMYANVTYKVDTAEDSRSAPWEMADGNYKDAWLHDGVRTLISEMLNGSRLSLKLEKTSSVFRFQIDESAKEGLSKVSAACTNTKG